MKTEGTKGFSFIVPQIPIIGSRYIEPTFPSGRIVCPDGSVKDKEGWTYQQDRFTTLEESDLPWLEGLEIVKEEMEEVYCIVDETAQCSGVRFEPK